VLTVLALQIKLSDENITYLESILSFDPGFRKCSAVLLLADLRLWLTCDLQLPTSLALIHTPVASLLLLSRVLHP
jgi:hypothetical protein